MQKPPTPHNEAARQKALVSLNILDTPAEERFDRVTRLARRLFDVPIALVSFVDGQRQWFKSRQGLEATETSREISFCGHAILGAEAFVVPDAEADGRFSDNPLVTDDPEIRFYAGYPLASPDGHRLGTLCIIDCKPRNLDDDELSLLNDLGRMVEAEMAALSLASVDELTGISNRRGFMGIGEKVLAVCARNAKCAALLYFDLNDFKLVNDQHGHSAGDDVLIEFADLLLETFRDSDVVARLGGDEFCVLSTGSDTDGLERPLEVLANRVSERNKTAGNRGRISYSVGLKHYDPARHASVTALLDDSDQAMYVDKRVSRLKVGDALPLTVAK